MSYGTKNGSGTWPAPLAGKPNRTSTTARRQIKHDSVAARLLVALRNNYSIGMPEAMLLEACELSQAPITSISNALASLEDRQFAAFQDDGWHITTAGQEAANECVLRGTPEPIRHDRNGTISIVTPPNASAAIRVSAPGITRLAHCLGGRLDDCSSGKSAGRTGGDDWRAFPSRQGDWLVYRDGRRVHITESNTQRQQAQ